MDKREFVATVGNVENAIAGVAQIGDGVGETVEGDRRFEIMKLHQ